MVDRVFKAVFKPITIKTAKKTYSYPAFKVLDNNLNLPVGQTYKIKLYFSIFPLDSERKLKQQNK